MGLMRLRGKKPPLFSWSAGNDHARWPQQAIFEAITTPGLADDCLLWELARVVCNRFVQVRIKFFSFRLARLQAVYAQYIVKVFQDERDSGVNRRVVAVAVGRFETALKIADNDHQSLERRAVREF